MARRSAIFTQTDVTRAVKGSVAAGLHVSRVEIDPNGKIIVVSGEPSNSAGENDWDK